MAFLQKLGSIAKRSATGSGSSLLQAVRCMSTSKVFVGGPDLSLSLCVPYRSSVSFFFLFAPLYHHHNLFCPCRHLVRHG
jgi:hypothetical protein